MNLTADASGIDRPLRTREETATLLRMIKTCSKAATLGQLTGGDKDAIRQEISDTLEEFDQVFFRASERRRRSLLERVDRGDRGDMPESGSPRDLLTILLRNEDNIDMPRDKIVKETAYFLFVGALSTTHALTHAMHHIFTWRAEHRRELALFDQAGFLRRCVWESLRLHPPTPELHRKRTCPVHRKSRAETFETGDVKVDRFEVDQDPMMFGALAQQFDPHRAPPPSGWLYGVTFGLGTRACLGRILLAGTPIQPDSDLDDAENGNTHLIVRALLDHGARPDPSNPPLMDTSNTRRNWRVYPLLLDRR